MRRARLAALGLWLLVLGVSGLLVARAHYSADLSALLPRSPSALQRLLVQQLRAGPSSRLILIGIDGGDPASRAVASHALARALRALSAFSLIANGEPTSDAREQAIAFEHRYQLSQEVTPERFSAAGLRTAIADSVDLLASPAGLAAEPLFARDPTGETLRVLDQWQPASQPRLEHGVWSSKDGQRALLLAQTQAQGSDTDAQQRAVASIREAFAAVIGSTPRAPRPAGELEGLSLQLSGPGVLSVQARDTIKQEAVRLSLFSTLLILLLLLAVYRSPGTLMRGMVPVVSGAIVGVAAVSVGFGVVYGVTLGFGATLIGESVDYPIYYFIQAGGNVRSGDHALSGEHTLWSIISLGALTSICGFASLLFSAFAGLAQLGLYSISGLIVAASVTRWILPTLTSHSRPVQLQALGARLQRTLARVHLPWTLALLFALTCAGWVYWHRDRLWNRELAALSPVPAAAQALDTQMRADLGAPDVSNLVIVSADSEEQALERAERVGLRLDRLAAEHQLGGYDSPARYLPSLATQQARLRALPEAAPLRSRLAAATVGLPVDATTLEPFVQQVSAARQALPVTRATLAGTSLGLAVDSLLWHESSGWSALLPLRAPSEPERDIRLPEVRAALADLLSDGVLVFNLKQETDRLYDEYLSAAMRQSLLGLAAIVLLLALALRSTRRLVQVLAPLLLAVLAVSALLIAAGDGLTIMHLIGMLLIIAIGSNYALFFDRSAVDDDPVALPRTLASLLVANCSTVIAFGVLASSRVPVLNALGRTVAPGTLLVLVFAALLAPRKLFRSSSEPLTEHRHESTRDYD